MDAILLKYKDNKGNTYEEYIVGYLEKDFSGSANISIINITENGKLDMNIK